MADETKLNNEAMGNNIDELRAEIARLRERTSQLSAATLRISESLDLDSVLREVVDSARVLTGAANAVITIGKQLDQYGDFISSGLTREELRQLRSLTQGKGIGEYLLQIPATVADHRPVIPSACSRLSYRTDSLEDVHGGSDSSPRCARRQFLSYQQGRRLGIHRRRRGNPGAVRISAATAIANAQAYRDEQRARADLEALVDTSPVGVAVFEAKTGALVRFNREGRRIVAGLDPSGRSPEKALLALKVRRADGEELSFAELPLARALVNAETVRAEEIVLSVPDGSSVRTLVNATPIRSDNGEVESLVVAFQDLEPLEELERQRTEFLSMVSHELRAPLASILGSTRTLLTAMPELDLAEQREFHRIIDEQAQHMQGLISDLLDAGRIDLGTLSVVPQATDVAALVDQARNTFLGGGGRHTIVIDLPSDLPLVMADQRRIVQVLNNLLANAARFSPESSPILVEAVRDGVHVAVSVADQGRGIPPERLPHLFRKHAGRGDEAGTVRYGLGLAICKGLVRPTAGASGPRAGGPARVRGSHLPFRLLPGPRPSQPPNRQPWKPPSGRASLLSTTILTRCAWCATSS